MMRKLFAVLLLIPALAFAALSPTPVFVQTPKQPKVQIVNGSGTTAQTVYACGASGSKVIGLLATSTDTANRDVTLSVLRSATSYALSTVTVPLGAGTVAGTPAVNLISPSNLPGLPSDSDGNPFFFCESTDTIQAAAVVTVTSGKAINVVAIVADF